MAETATEVSAIGLVDTTQRARRPKRRQWTEAFKRQVVAETLEPGASVSIVARRHDLNANQLFKWRREMVPEQPPAAEQSVTMLPVTITPEAVEARPRVRRTGTIEITLAIPTRKDERPDAQSSALSDARSLRLEGAMDAYSMRMNAHLVRRTRNHPFPAQDR